jgi:hypothetical protein
MDISVFLHASEHFPVLRFSFFNFLLVLDSRVMRVFEVLGV